MRRTTASPSGLTPKGIQGARASDVETLDDMEPEERAALLASIRQAERDERAGMPSVPAREVLEMLRAKRR